MPFFPSPAAATVAAAIALTLLTACGKNTPVPADPPVTPMVAASVAHRALAAKTAPATPAAAASAPASAATAFRVTAVTLGTAVDSAHKVTQPTTHFAANEKTIYASVTSTGSTRDTTLTARWNYLQGAGQLITSVTQRLATEGPATTTFTVQNPDLWPEGKYNVEISVDGKPVSTQAFQIDKAE